MIGGEDAAFDYWLKGTEAAPDDAAALLKLVRSMWSWQEKGREERDRALKWAHGYISALDKQAADKFSRYANINYDAPDFGQRF